MNPETYIAAADDPGCAALETCDAISRGGVILSTTDTVCGLLARTEAGIERIIELKQRPSDAPIAVLVNPDSPVVSWIVRTLPLADWMRELLPGPLTVVLPREMVAAMLPDDMLALPYATFGFRAVYYPPLWPVIDRLGGYVFATSANSHGAPSAASISDVERAIKSGVDMIIDGGCCPLGLASAVVEYADGGWTILRRLEKTARLAAIWEPAKGNDNSQDKSDDPFWNFPPVAKLPQNSVCTIKSTAELTSYQRDMLTALIAWTGYNERSLSPGENE